ncbi:MAG: hypothetical protein WBA16_03095 [Nonlabens sp.]
MKVASLFVVFCLLHSCTFYKHNGIQVQFINESGAMLTDLRFTTSEGLDSIAIPMLSTGSKSQEYLSLSGHKQDGCYKVSFKQDGASQEFPCVGYYSNGSSLDYWVDIVVRKDSTSISFDAPIH